MRNCGEFLVTTNFEYKLKRYDKQRRDTRPILFYLVLLCLREVTKSRNTRTFMMLVLDLFRLYELFIYIRSFHAAKIVLVFSYCNSNYLWFIYWNNIFFSSYPLNFNRFVLGFVSLNATLGCFTSCTILFWILHPFIEACSTFRFEPFFI